MWWIILALVLLSRRAPVSSAPSNVISMTGTDASTGQQVMIPRSPWVDSIVPVRDNSGDGFGVNESGTVILGDPALSATITGTQIIALPPVTKPAPSQAWWMPAVSGNAEVEQAPAAPADTATYQGYWPNGFTHYTDVAGNAIGSGASNAPNYPAPTVVKVTL